MIKRKFRNTLMITEGKSLLYFNISPLKSRKDSSKHQISPVSQALYSLLNQSIPSSISGIELPKTLSIHILVKTGKKRRKCSNY